jgi:hypothetical protein
LKSSGPRTDPCGTPESTSKGDEIIPPIRTCDNNNNNNNNNNGNVSYSSFGYDRYTRIGVKRYFKIFKEFRSFSCGTRD